MNLLYYYNGYDGNLLELFKTGARETRMCLHIKKNPIRFLDLTVHDLDEINYMKLVIDKVANHGRFINGPEVEQFNYLVAKYLGSPYALGVGSGTDALIIALLALGVGPGDEVILPCLSFVGSASAVSMVGATPIFCDIKRDLTIDAELIIPLLTSKTKIIMPVHFTGKMAQMESILSIAKQHNINVIEDAAPSFGADHNEKKAGTYADIGCFSMNPMKILGAWGEAGLVVTHSKKYYQKLEQLRYHNIQNKNLCMGRGINARLDVIQAASLIYRLVKVDKNISRRHAIANYYNERLNEYVETPQESDLSTHVYYTYSILTPVRDKLQEYLTQHNIESKIYHEHLIPRHMLYKAHHQHKQAFPVGDSIVKQILCLPIHEKLKDAEIEIIASTVRQYFRKNYS